jgi:uncharacterized membrane protein
MAMYLAALLLGVVAGLRTMMPLAALSWATRLGAIRLAGTRLAFLGHGYIPWVLGAAAILELITDQLPSTPSRKVPLQFGARILSGAFCGAAMGWTAGSWTTGALFGIGGAIIGTLGGSWFRGRLASAFRKDRPAALIEDVVAIGGAVLILAFLG